MKAKEKDAIIDGMKTIIDMLSDINVGDCAIATTEAVIAAVISKTNALCGYVKALDTDDGRLKEFCQNLCGKLYDRDMHYEEGKLRSLLEENA